MIRARVWQTEDGKQFNDRAAARKHEAWLELVALCGLELGVDNEDAEGLARAMVDNTGEIIALLRRKPEPAD